MSSTTAPAPASPSTEAGGTPPTPASAPGRGLTHSLGLDRFSGLYVLAGLVVVFGFMAPDTFLTTTTLRSIATQQAVTALVALALLLPMAAGAFDVSVGYTLGLSMVLVTWLQSEQGWNHWAAIVLALAVGALVGAVNALVIVRLKVNSFIATLGMSSVLTALIMMVSGGQQITTGISDDFKKLGQSTFGPIPAPVVYLVVVAAVLWFVLEYRPAGRRVYATGGNPTAARLTGIRVDRITTMSLVACGLVAALAGVVFASMVGSSSPTAGSAFLLPAFAAVFLGSTQIHNGRPNVLGTLVAIFVLATGVKGLLLLGVPLWVSDLFNGLVLIAAVALAVMKGGGSGPKGP